MRRIIVLAAVAAIAFAAVPAHATGGVVNGRIMIGNPTNGPYIGGDPLPLWVVGGITHNAGCSTSSPVQGVDGYWVTVPNHRGHAATLTPTDPGPAAGFAPAVDFDVWFFDAGCNFIDYPNMAQGVDTNYFPGYPYTQFGDVETGIVPANATWALVVFWAGYGAPNGAGFRFEF